MSAREFVVETARLQDAPRLFEISSIVHRTNYAGLIPSAHLDDFLKHYQDTPHNRDQFTKAVVEKLRDAHYHTWKASDKEGYIVGYLSLQQRDDSSEVSAVFIDPDYQHKGLGSLLMDTAVRAFEDSSMELFVIDANTSAKALYGKYAFKATGVADKTFFGATLIHMMRPATR